MIWLSLVSLSTWLGLTIWSTGGMWRIVRRRAQDRTDATSAVIWLLSSTMALFGIRRLAFGGFTAMGSLEALWWTGATVYALVAATGVVLIVRAYRA